MKILFASKNKNKFKEIKEIFKDSKFEIIFDDDLEDVVEDKDTILGNAQKKSEEIFLKHNIPVLSDDSGLCINALRGKPGIYSARWAKKYGSFPNAMRFILKKMKNKRNRFATFVCSLSLKYPKGKIITVTGHIKGSISHKIIGSRGFGYDPIFIPLSKSITFGQMLKAQKIRINHRYIAFRKMKRKIKIF